MAPEAAVKEGAAATPITETPEFKEALAKERETHRLNLDAEYKRKQEALEAQYAGRSAASSPPAGNGADPFVSWGERYGLPPEAGKELVAGAVAYVQNSLLPETLKPLTESAKRNELRSQRAEVRTGNAKLAKLDDRFHAEVMALLTPMDARLIGAESYARALHMVIGQHIEELEAGGSKAEPPAEIAPGPEPTPAPWSRTPPKGGLSAYQQRLCEEKGWDAEFFIDLIRSRARKMEENGKSKVEIRKLLGEQLGSIEF